jgi:hypothetical protein
VGAGNRVPVARLGFGVVAKTIPKELMVSVGDGVTVPPRSAVVAVTSTASAVLTPACVATGNSVLKP